MKSTRLTAFAQIVAGQLSEIRQRKQQFQCNYFLVRLVILGNFNRDLKRDINSVSRGREANNIDRYYIDG